MLHTGKLKVNTQNISGQMADLTEFDLWTIVTRLLCFTGATLSQLFYHTILYSSNDLVFGFNPGANAILSISHSGSNLIYASTIAVTFPIFCYMNDTVALQSIGL
jgi:hypothetical protein